MHSRSLLLGALALCALVSMGCGGAETVSGRVTLDGAPLPAAYLTLVPKDPKVKGPFIAKTDEQGQFAFGSIEEPGSGAPAGALTTRINTGKTVACWLSSESCSFYLRLQKF